MIKPGTVLNDIFSHEDMLPTLLAAAGDPDVKAKLLTGMKVGDKTFKVHLDGYDLTDALAGKSPSPRHEFFYFNDRGDLAAVRYNQYKITFRNSGLWREAAGGLFHAEHSQTLQPPRRSFEEADHSADYWSWRVDHICIMVLYVREVVANFMATFRNTRPARRWAVGRSDGETPPATTGAGKLRW